MNFLKGYSNMTNIERREAICRWLLSRARGDVSWHECQSYQGKKKKLANYNSNLYFYTGKDDEGKEAFTGLNFNKNWVMRDILIQDLVIEVEKQDDLLFNDEGTCAISENLMRLGIEFYIFWHEGGRTPHIHIYNLFPNVDSWAEKELAANLFCNKVVPAKYLPFIDRSLFGEHQISLEFSKHYKSGKMNKPYLVYSPGGICTQ